MFMTVNKLEIAICCYRRKEKTIKVSENEEVSCAKAVDWGKIFFIFIYQLSLVYILSNVFVQLENFVLSKRVKNLYGNFI